MPGTTVEQLSESPADYRSASSGADGALFGTAQAATDPPAGYRQEVAAPETATEEQLATIFADTFEPTDDVAYAWVFDYAKDRFVSALAVLKDLEDKASSAITFLGSGAGLLTMGAAIAVANPNIDRSVVAWSIPSITCALVALGFALMGRRTVGVPYPPAIDGVLRLADYAVTELRGKSLFAAQLHLCVATMKPVLVKKAFWVEWCLRIAVVSVALMLLPLIAALSIPRKTDPPAIPVAANFSP